MYINLNIKYKLIFIFIKYISIFIQRLVVWRKGNKAIVRLNVTPFENDEIKEELVTVGFVMQHGYVNTITALEHKAPQKLDLKVKLYLSLGKLCKST